MRLRFRGESRSSRAVSRLCAAACAFTALQCLDQPLEPVVPSWDVPLTLPLANRTHFLSEIVERDTSMLHAGAGGLIVYHASVPAPATVVGNLLTVRPPDTTASVRFGTFAVSAPPVSAPLVIPWLPAGGMLPIPDTTIGFPSVPLDVPTFESVTFAEGAITLTIANNLPVAVDVQGPVTLTDNAGRTVAVFQFVPATIAANASRSASDDLAGKTAGHLMAMNGLVIHTGGSSAPVPIPSGDPLALTLSTAGARARRAEFAQIPPQRLVDNDSTSLRLDDSTLVREMRFSSGILRFSFVNHVALSMFFRFRFQELFRTVGGQRVAYEDSVLLPAGGGGTADINLAGLSIHSPTGNLLHALEAVSSITLPSGSGQPVTVTDTDRVDIHLTTVSQPVIDTAVAVIRPTWLDVNVPVPVDFGDLPTRFSGTLNIPAARLGLSTVVSFGFPTDLYIVIGARTQGNTWTYLSVPGTQKRILPGAGSVTFDTTEVGTFLSAFNGRLPDTLFVLGQVLVNPPEVYTPTPAGAGSIGRTSAFRGTVLLDVPLMLGIADGTYRDTLSIGDTTGDGAVDFAVDRARLADIQRGNLYVEIENGLPLAVDVRLRLLDGGQRTLLALPRPGEQMGAGAAMLDAGGNVTAPAFRRTTVVLGTADVRQFDATSFLAYALQFNTPPGGVVRFRLSDYVHVRVWSTLSYRVNG